MNSLRGESGGKLPCVYCGSQNSRVVDSRGTWRRRECIDCGTRQSTRELVIVSHDPVHRAKMQHPTLF